MKQYDTNGDGKIAGDELDKAPALKSAIENLDTSGDGAVDADEVTARIEAWQESKLGRTSLMCRVVKGGQPFEGATVTFVPEKFLGENLKPASGVTDANGTAMLSIELSDSGDPPGVAPGLYRVEITKEGANIPAKYNTETIYGQEVGLDAANIMEGLVYEID